MRVSGRYILIRTIVMLGAGSLLFSCATLLNKKTDVVLIKTSRPTDIIFNSDTVSTVHNQAWLSFVRAKKPLTFLAKSDSISEEITLMPVNSLAFNANIFNYGIGALIDLKNPKRYTYNMVVLDSSGKEVVRLPKRNRTTPQKGSLYFHLSIPEVNNFILKPDDYGKKNNTGCLGIIGGLDYYYTDNRFVSIMVGAATDFPVPFPAPVDHFGPYESFFSTFLSVSNNHRIKHFSIGYGLSYTRNGWGIFPGMFDATPNPEITKRINNSAGVIVTSYYRLSKAFHIGVIYRPTFIRFETENRFAYEHLLTLDLAWKIRLKK